ncbi:MAG: YceI family protein [Pseudomonadales bacterium]|nr:YceI family protein [Pseudomonadales bacterium]
MKTFLKVFTFVGCLLLIPGLANAQWSLNNGESTLSFVSVKAEHVAEVHTFDVMSGEIGADGGAEITVELASVNTLIPIRNERMQAMLFETNMFPRATIEADLDLGSLTAMAPGYSETMQLNFSLSLHGVSRSYSSEIKVTRLADGFVASTIKPIVVTAEDFSLQSGVEALREIAGLPSISRAVPVSFTVQFDR